MSKEIVDISAGEIVGRYKVARRDVAQARGEEPPTRSLYIARRFDELHPDASSYFWDLSSVHRFVPAVPAAIAAVTDPEVSHVVLKQEDLRSLSTDTPAHNGFKVIHGEFIFFRDTEEGWRADKSNANREYSRSKIVGDEIDALAGVSLDSILANNPQDELSPLWTKNLIAQIILRHLTEQELDYGSIQSAVQAHSKFVQSSLIPIASGKLPFLRPILANGMLEPYFELIDDVTQNIDSMDPQSPIRKIIDRSPGGRANSRDILMSLVAGLNNTRSLFDFSLHNLGANKDVQEAARDDEELLKRVIWETSRMYPTSPYTTRRAVDELEIEGRTIPKGAIVVFSSFAYGGPKYVENADSFDPERANLREMAKPGGEANLFSSGPRSCLAKDSAPQIVLSALKEVLARFEVESPVDPHPILGGVTLRPDKPIEFTLIDRESGRNIKAPSSFRV